MRQLMLPMSAYTHTLESSHRLALATGSANTTLNTPLTQSQSRRSRIGYSPLARLTRLLVEWTGVFLVVAVPYCIGTLY